MNIELAINKLIQFNPKREALHISFDSEKGEYKISTISKTKNLFYRILKLIFGNYFNIPNYDDATTVSHFTAITNAAHLLGKLFPYDQQISNQLRQKLLAYST